ncbi:protein PHYTOCHROME KINASE SUBSTRATE 1-like [Hibiscus syriacus]|nr:protein PHYTOCHROME KINASE SUBSTRATE 1-like [Hibiscus syriacus]
MAMITLTSNYKTNLPRTLPFEENYLRKLSSSSPNITTNQDEHYHPGLKKEEDREIGVFGAEKYFNGGIHAESPRITKIDTITKTLECVKDEGIINIEPIKPVTHQGTLSVRSESSWNSQSALLQGVMRNPPGKKLSKLNGKGFLSGLAGCKCYCSGRKSIDIDEVQVGEISFKSHGKQTKTATIMASLEVNKPVPEPWMKEEIFTFPATNSGMGIRPVKVSFQGDVDEIGRKSLEVFGSPVLGRRNKSMNIERRLKMLSCDSTPKVEGNENPKGDYNDAQSDASSDLFEIESLTGKANPFFVKQASDVASGCATPTTCYAPSEASIEWSVVTASAVDFSVMSDYEELRPSRTLPSPLNTFLTTTRHESTKTDKEFRRHLFSGLLGCNSQKAVDVAGDAHKTNEKAAGFNPSMIRVSDSYIPATRFQDGAKLAGAFQHNQRPRASHLLHIQ